MFAHQREEIAKTGRVFFSHMPLPLARCSGYMFPSDGKAKRERQIRKVELNYFWKSS